MVDFDDMRLSRFAIGGPNPKEGFTHGPEMLLTKRLDEVPGDNLITAFIYKLSPDGKQIRMFRWREGTMEWVRTRR